MNWALCNQARLISSMISKYCVHSSTLTTSLPSHHLPLTSFFCLPISKLQQSCIFHHEFLQFLLRLSFPVFFFTCSHKMFCLPLFLGVFFLCTFSPPFTLIWMCLHLKPKTLTQGFLSHQFSPALIFCTSSFSPPCGASFSPLAKH